MNITQLAIVLDHIDTSLHDTGLLTRYEQLIDALVAIKSGGSDNMERVQVLREELVEVLEQTEPHGWSVAQLEAYRTYGADVALGDGAVERLNQAFVENFMNPAGLLAAVEQHFEEGLALAERVDVLLKGLDPVLANAPTQGDVIEPAYAMPQAKPSLGAMVRQRLNFAPRRDSTALVQQGDGVPLATKLAAAAPVVLAAATKAIEIYRTYNEAKSSLVKAQPTKQPEPTVIRPNPPQNPTYVRYTYRRSVYVFNRHD